MAKLSRDQRDDIARRRISNILRQHGVANSRTLEQKISDAGPNPQRIDPHILTPIRQQMVDEGIIRVVDKSGAKWFHLATTSSTTITQRLNAQLYVRSSHSTKIASTL